MFLISESFINKNTKIYFSCDFLFLGYCDTDKLFVLMCTGGQVHRPAFLCVYVCVCVRGDEEDEDVKKEARHLKK